jgi:alkanesulfonate monooxygenase
MQNSELGLRIFTTCPPVSGFTPETYLNRVREIARWSDNAGCEGILVYTDNAMLDPWLVSQAIIESTQALAPLVAVQAVYMHPYAVAKAVSTLGYLHNRRVCLNMVAGGFKNDLTALNDLTPHERRYDRLVEYTTIIQRLLASTGPVTYSGDFYSVQQLTLKPALSPELFPLVTISGSSPEGLAAARALQAIPVKYPQPPGKSEPEVSAEPSGIRVGIIAREDEDAAWTCALHRFPPDRAGKILHNMAMKVSDSVWHKQLSDLANETRAERSTYWLEPFQNYKTFCPYLVGSYEQVGVELGKYIREGCRLFILDVPREDEDFVHIRNAFAAAREGALHVTATNR